MTSPSITEQIRAAVEAAGGQAAALQKIRETGGKLTQPQLSRLCRGRRPSLETLGEIATALEVDFVITPRPDLGSSRPAYQSDKKK